MDTLELKYQEQINIFRELFLDDVYHASQTLDEGDRWLDLGCHTGWFSWLAIAHGAAVSGGVDADAETLEHYRSAIVHSHTLHAMVQTAQDLLTIFEYFTEQGRGFNCVKLDIQGGEKFLTNGTGLDPFHSPAGSAVDKLLLEWHYPERLPELITALENDVFAVEIVERNEDILTREDTHIVFATRKPFT